MKNFIFLLLSISVVLHADLSVTQIQEMVNKIHQKRIGVNMITLEDTKEPFVRLQTDNNSSIFVIPEVKKSEDAKLVLHAIVNGRAYINDDWLKVNDNILGYQLKFIGKRGVILRNENHIKKLFMRKIKDSFIKLEEK